MRVSRCLRWKTMWTSKASGSAVQGKFQRGSYTHENPISSWIRIPKQVTAQKKNTRDDKSLFKSLDDKSQEKDTIYKHIKVPNDHVPAHQSKPNKSTDK